MRRNSSSALRTPEFEKSQSAEKQLTLFNIERADACERIHVQVNGCGSRSELKMGATPSFGIVRGYDDLLDVARTRMTQLSITHETLDSISGVASGYSAKLLGPNPSKRFGMMSFGAIMGALGIQLIAVEDVDALARVQPRLIKRKVSRAQTHWRHRPSTAA